MTYPDPTDAELALRECTRRVGCGIFKHAYEFTDLKSPGHLTQLCFECRGSTVPDKIQVCTISPTFLLLSSRIFTYKLGMEKT